MKRQGGSYLGDFLTDRPPESLAMEDRFMVEREYTLVPKRKKKKPHRVDASGGRRAKKN